MPRQFLKESVMSFRMGSVEMVLSQFWTLMVWSAISVTHPSAFWLGISIQSPIRTMSLEEICMAATTERIVS